MKSFSNLYNDELQQLKQEYGISNSDPLNGWNKLDHERFVKILDEYSNQTQEKYTLFCERIKMELPYKTSNSISNHYNWYQRQVTFSIKKECLKKSIDDYIEKFIHSTIQNITDEKIQIQEFQVRQQERQNQLEEMQTRHHLLNNWRKNKIQSMIENQTQLQDQIKNQMKREYEKNQNERLRRLEIKNNLIKYHDMLRQQKNEEMKLMHELKLKEAQIKEQERKVNQTRIEYREKNRLNKLKEREMKLQAIMQEKVELEARLDRLRKSVAVNVECDWNRAIQDTVSVLEHKKNTDRPNWYQTVGFSSDQIIKDKRMQLSMQLYKHGLSQSTYGRDVLLSLQPPVQRLDQKSSIRFEHD
ncbi:hypothetical protein BC833DRAFT_98899 [Globomyces pollinis-pini]|nr:hypothetical protein BC833DRAFT_98899 [Globomyces pollinis-pini]